MYEYIVKNIFNIHEFIRQIIEMKVKKLEKNNFLQSDDVIYELMNVMKKDKSDILRKAKSDFSDVKKNSNQSDLKVQMNEIQSSEIQHDKSEKNNEKKDESEKSEKHENSDSKMNDEEQK
ncbi:hypothetical protein FQN54_009302 [Arachnomyces sp. PD_36]|nr:hypothetical protein FQN54_009302 [Arachnomyces sp. PD_36]